MNLNDARDIKGSQVSMRGSRRINPQGFKGMMEGTAMRGNQ